MLLTMLQAKIHRATISDANLGYVGSITIDRNLLAASGILEYQQVEIANINNGERFTTYVMASDNKGTICINGAAARKVAIGDLIIIMAYATMSEDEAAKHTPTVVHVDDNNQLVQL